MAEVDYPTVVDSFTVDQLGGYGQRVIAADRADIHEFMAYTPSDPKNPRRGDALHSGAVNALKTWIGGIPAMEVVEENGGDAFFYHPLSFGQSNVVAAGLKSISPYEDQILYSAASAMTEAEPNLQRRQAAMAVFTQGMRESQNAKEPEADLTSYDVTRNADLIEALTDIDLTQIIMGHRSNSAIARELLKAMQVRHIEIRREAKKGKGTPGILMMGPSGEGAILRKSVDTVIKKGLVFHDMVFDPAEIMVGLTALTGLVQYVKNIESRIREREVLLNKFSKAEGEGGLDADLQKQDVEVRTQGLSAVRDVLIALGIRPDCISRVLTSSQKDEAISQAWRLREKYHRGLNEWESLTDSDFDNLIFAIITFLESEDDMEENWVSVKRVFYYKGK